MVGERRGAAIDGRFAPKHQLAHGDPRTAAASAVSHAGVVAQPALEKGARVNAGTRPGGGSDIVAGAVRAAEIVFYRRIIALCLANGLSSSNFTQALRDLGTGGS
jgi:hypothetical protein